MIFPNMSDEWNMDYRRGRDAGFEIAESYLKSIARKFYKEMKHGLLEQMATCTTITSHKCNCEFCKYDEKEIKA